MRSRFTSRFSKFQVSCATCGATTTKHFARANDGRCKLCVSGVPTASRTLESYRNGGSYDGRDFDGGDSYDGRDFDGGDSYDGRDY